MAAHLEELNYMQQHEKKIQHSDGEEKKDGTQYSITNIYYDCLERIFEFLDLKSLLNVAQTCKRLQIAAAAKFGDECGKKGVFLEIITDSQTLKEPGFYKVDGEFSLYIIGMKVCLPFLRCFGSKLSDLGIGYFDTSLGTENVVDCYINQYCADSLIYLLFIRKWNFPIDSFPKPFQKVETPMCPLTPTTVFTNLFPKLQYLEIYGSRVNLQQQ